MSHTWTRLDKGQQHAKVGRSIEAVLTQCHLLEVAPLGHKTVAGTIGTQIRDKVHEHTVACADELMKSRGALESHEKNRKRPKAEPTSPMTTVGPLTLPLRL